LSLLLKAGKSFASCSEKGVAGRSLLQRVEKSWSCLQCCGSALILVNFLDPDPEGQKKTQKEINLCFEVLGVLF
jgi:hypothetical protein